MIAIFSRVLSQIVHLYLQNLDLPFEHICRYRSVNIEN